MVGVVADRVSLELQAQSDRYIASLRSAERSFERTMNNMARRADFMERQVSRSMFNMSNTMRTAIAAIGVGAAIKSAQELADTWTQSANKLAAAGVAMSSVNAVQGQLADLARETRSEFASTANLYARLTRSTADLGVNQAQVARTTELVNKAFKAGGATTQEQLSSVLQLTQALGSGLLQGDELRSLRENAPIIARALAKELNTTVGGLKKLGAEGKITADVVMKAILNAGDEIDRQFARTRATVGESFTAMRTEALRFLGTFDQATDATSGIANFINHVADNFDLLAQSVLIASAVVSTALGVRMTRAMAETARQNNSFVRALMAGTVSLDLKAEAARKAARDELLLARTDADAARQTRATANERVNQLRQEAAAYQQNIALAERQMIAARQAAVAARANRAAGFGSIAGSVGAATAAENQAHRALIVNRQALRRTTDELTGAQRGLALSYNAVTAAEMRVVAGERVMQAAMVQTSLVTRAASVAMRGLSGAMAFFGGPIGVAIIAVAGALAYFSTEAMKAAGAGEQAQGVLEGMRMQADETRESAVELTDETENLSTAQRDNQSAANQSANANNNAAVAYNNARQAALDAAEAVRYLTAQQRQQRLEKVDEAISDLVKAREGFNPIATNQQERVRNAQREVLKQMGVGGAAGYFGQQSRNIMQEAANKAATQHKDSPLNRAIQEFNNAAAVLQDQNQTLDALRAQREVIFRSIDDLTEPKPPTPTGNIRAPGGVGGDDDKSGGKKGRGRQGPTPEELAAQREMLELQGRINIARAAGADELAQFLEDERERIQLIKSLVDAGLGVEEATRRADAYTAELRAARELAEAEEQREERERELKKLQEDEAERIEDMRRRQLWLQEQELQVQLELARLAGDSERVRELERMLDLMHRIREYQDQGGLPEDEAKRRAREDQDKVDDAEAQGKVRDFFKGAVRAAFDGELSDYLENWWKDALMRANDRVIDHLFNALEQVFKDIDWSSIFKGAGGSGGIFEAIGSAFGSIFGGGRAGGGLMLPGRLYKVGENGPEVVSVGGMARAFPNSSYRAHEQQSGSAGGLSITVINNTGVPASAEVQRTPEGVKIQLQPMFERGVEGAGQSGALMRGLRATPRPVRRG